MMTTQVITPDLIMADIMKRWPATIMLFVEYRMACVGCSMSMFDTLGDALNAYNLPQEEVLREIDNRIRSKYTPDGNVQ